MASEEHDLRTHDRGRFSRRELDQPPDSIPESFRQHVISVIAKALVAEAGVSRQRTVLVLLGSTPTEDFHPKIFDADFLQSRSEVALVEMR